jgi:predicted alpha/beta superfamily hydrolase
MRKVAKIKEIIDNGIEGNLKRFEAIMGYSLSGKLSLNILK